MGRKSRQTIDPLEELDFLKEKNKTLVKEIVQHKNSRKQLQQDLDYMTKENFIAEQKLLRFEKICSEVDQKTRSCLDRMVQCSEDLTGIFSLLKTFNNIKHTQHIVGEESVLTEIRNFSSNHDVQRSRNKSNMKNSYEDTSQPESTLTPKADKTVHSGNNLGNVTLTNTQLLNNEVPIFDKSHPPENAEESTGLHESSFVSRGGKTVLSEISNLDMSDFDSETEMDAADGIDDQTNLTPAGKVLSIIHEDWESGESDEGERQTDAILPDATPLMTLRNVSSMAHNDQDPSHHNVVNLERISQQSDCNDISTYVEPNSAFENSIVNSSNLKTDNGTPKISSKDHSTSGRDRLSFIKRKSIGSPRPSFHGRTNSILRKSDEKQRLSGGRRRLSLGEKRTPTLEITNPPAASSTLLEDRTPAPPLLETTLKAAHDLSYLPELLKNTSTPIQSTLTSRSRNGKKITRTICDDEEGKKIDSGINKIDKTSVVQEKMNVSKATKNLDPFDTGDISLRCSKRRRCPTINLLQQYVESSRAKPRRTVKSNKFDSYVDPEPSVDEQTIESPPKITNTSANKKLTIGARGKRSPRSTIKGAADLKRVEQQEYHSESTEHSDDDENSSQHTMVPNITPSPPKKNTDQNDNPPRLSKKRKCEESKDTAKNPKLNTSEESEPSEDEKPYTEVAEEDDNLAKKSKRKKPSIKTVKKKTKSAKTSASEAEENGLKSKDAESSAVKMVQNEASSQENTSDHSVSASRTSTRQRKLPVDLVQEYIESTRRTRRPTKATCYKEPSIHRKERRN